MGWCGVPPREALGKTPFTPELLCPPTVGDCVQLGTLTPFKVTPFCFYLTGYTNNLFRSRKIWIRQFKGRAQHVLRKGHCELTQRICAQRLLPDPRINKENEPVAIRLTGSQVTTFSRVNHLRCRDLEFTWAVRGPPSGRSRP